MLKDIEAVIFDMDGTLLDSMWVWKQIDIEFLGKYGYKPTRESNEAIAGKSFLETAEYFKSAYQLSMSTEAIMDEWNRMAYDKYQNEVLLKDGAREFLQYCSEKKLPMGIATSNSRVLVDTVLASLNIADYFAYVCTTLEVENSKPHPDVYLKVAKELQAEPEHCLVFEDLIPGVQAGLAAGMKVCNVYDKYSREEEEYKQRIADYSIRNYHEIIN